MSELQEWKDKLAYAPKDGFDVLTEAELKAVGAYCEEYKAFLDYGKTERLCVEYAVAKAKAAGFKALVPGMALKAGDKVYSINRDKTLYLAILGKMPLEQGTNIAVAHIDSPRFDLRPRPIMEKGGLGYLDTHFYGSIRKHEWVNHPMAVHGVVYTADGRAIKIDIGEKPEEPRFMVCDLLYHLSAGEKSKHIVDAYTNDDLRPLAASRPLGKEPGQDRIRMNMLKLLNEKYGVVEEDLISAELELVPAEHAGDLGLDRSMIYAYGHDDRVCAFPELKAILELENPEKTAVCILMDKEEISSQGATGARSQGFDWFMEELCLSQKALLRRCFANSVCISADVTCAYDPNHPEVFVKDHTALMNYGIGVEKYTGQRGKSKASDASAQLMLKMRNMLNENHVLWQPCEFGKPEFGGGGTVCMYFANRNIDAIDIGVALLSMHAPLEVASKIDCYMMYRCCVGLYNMK